MQSGFCWLRILSLFLTLQSCTASRVEAVAYVRHAPFPGARSEPLIDRAFSRMAVVVPLDDLLEGAESGLFFLFLFHLSLLTFLPLFWLLLLL